jgi:hypothetical protein
MFTTVDEDEIRQCHQYRPSSIAAIGPLFWHWCHFCGYTVDGYIFLRAFDVRSAPDGQPRRGLGF